MYPDIEQKPTDDTGSVLIEPCGHYPHWLNVVARWQVEASSAEVLSSSAGELALSTRLQVLEQQGVDDNIPVTYVAHWQGEPLGCVSLVDYPRLGGMPPSYWVANLFVEESQRRQGLASEMLSVVEAHAEKQSVAELYLYATDQVGYYRNRGWQEVSRKNVGGCPTTIMRKFLCVLG